MEMRADGTSDVVDPLIRAHVSSLVVALGGSGADEDGRYELGDDALACLRDIKKWLKVHDERNNRLDVARCLAESNLVAGDLLHILSGWSEQDTDDKIKYKIALACIELLVPLTWPIDKGEKTNNHHRHTPYLQLAQLSYKRQIINWDLSRILKTAVRTALPPIAVDLDERSPREQGIIKLVLYFLRNIALIAPTPANASDSDEAEISRSATIDAFDYQDIFDFILPLSSSMGEDFNTEDVVVMELIFHLVKGVDIEKLFMNEKQLETNKVNELASLRKLESHMLKETQRNAPTRHNRFGTLVWVKGEENKMSVVSGQSALINTSKALEKMDKSKKFKAPQRRAKTTDGPLDFNAPVVLSVRANHNLRKFVEEFLDAGFNPLFGHLRKAIDREAERVQLYHSRQFFYLVAWFLEAERVRRRSNIRSKQKANPEADDSFGLVASVLNQEMFITLNKAMETAYENKEWQDLNAAMRCFTQILLTVQEMTESPLADDQEIAENILSRIFYEETTHDRVANIVRYYNDQGFGYLDAVTELAHVYLRILEQYSKQNSELQIRSKRQKRRRKKKKDGTSDAKDAILDDSDQEEMEAAAARTTSERKFEFKKFAARFVSQGAVDTFVTFCRYYKDLKPEQLKRCHRYFFRVAIKMEMSVMLFRVDIIHMLHKMIKGPGGLDPRLPSFPEWDELVKQLLKRCTRKMQERPELIVEMLFSKTNGTAHYLEYGYSKQMVMGTPRPAVAWEVKGSRPSEEHIPIVVSVLIDRNENDLLSWVKEELESAVKARKAWEIKHAPTQSIPTEADSGLVNVTTSIFGQVEPAPITTNDNSTSDISTPTTSLKPPSILLTPTTHTQRLALFKNPHLRLLLTLLSLQNLADNETPDTLWTIPSSISSSELSTNLTTLNSALHNPFTLPDTNTIDLLRRIPKPRPGATYDTDSATHSDTDSEIELFPPGGPSNKHSALTALKAKRSNRAHKSSSTPLSLLDPEKQAAQKARKEEREREKNRKIKSALFVADSDDEEWDEGKEEAFLERQREILEAAKKAGGGVVVGPGKKSDKKGGKRKVVGGFLDDDDDEEDGAGDALIEEAEGGESPVAISSDADSEDEDEPVPRNAKRRRLGSESDEDMDDIDMDMDVVDDTPASLSKEKEISTRINGDGNGEEEEEEDIPTTSRPRRRIGGFLEDSDDE